MQNDSYAFDGQIISSGGENTIHGLVSKEKFQLGKIDISSDYASITLTCDKLVSSPVECYPFRLELSVTYTLSGRKLLVEISGKNVDDKTIPFSCGWHPYFRLSEKGIDLLSLSIPYEKLILTDSNYIPYSNEMAYTPVSNLPGSDFRPMIFQKKRIIGRRMLNACYANTQRNTESKVESKIENLDNGSTLAIRQTRGILFCSTGTETQERFRESIVLHPAENIWNMFNRIDLAETVRLEPDSERKFAIEIEFSQP
jgi:aldose 1-epimerase